MISNKWHLRYNAPVFACLAIILMLLAVPTGFEGNLVFQESDIRAARVLSSDESMVIPVWYAPGNSAASWRSWAGRFGGGLWKGETC